MCSDSRRFPLILARALRVGEAAARLAHERGSIESTERIGFSFVHLPQGEPFTVWALENDHAFENFVPGEGPILFVPSTEGIPKELPEVEAAQALAIQRSLLNSGIDGVTVDDHSEVDM